MCLCCFRVKPFFSVSFFHSFFLRLSLSLLLSSKWKIHDENREKQKTGHISWMCHIVCCLLFMFFSKWNRFRAAKWRCIRFLIKSLVMFLSQNLLAVLLHFRNACHNSCVWRASSVVERRFLWLFSGLPLNIRFGREMKWNFTLNRS